MYLFSERRHGRQQYEAPQREPRLVWKYSLPSHPPRGPESSAAVDCFGNLYFGSHDGGVYSLTRDGCLRWVHITGRKVYSSPLVSYTKGITTVVIGGGNGFLYGFDPDGVRLWEYDLAVDFRFGKRSAQLCHGISHCHQIVDWGRRKIVTEKCWSSPNRLSDGTIVSTGYGYGVHAVDPLTGECRWRLDCGWPRYHFTGVAIGLDDVIYVATGSGEVIALDASGHVLWRKRWGVLRRLRAWGNPSIDRSAQMLYVPFTRGERFGRVLALGFDGRLKWDLTLKVGLRGSVLRWHEDTLVTCALDGHVLIIDRNHGRVREALRLSNARRALWTTPTIDCAGKLLVTSKDGKNSGSLWCLDAKGKKLWRKRIGKALSVPVLDEEGRLYVGDWLGAYYCFAP